MRLTVGAKNFELGTIKPVQPIPRAKPHNSVTDFKTTYNGVATPKMGLDKIFPNSQVNMGIIIAILFAVAMFILMN